MKKITSTSKQEVKEAIRQIISDVVCSGRLIEQSYPEDPTKVRLNIELPTNLLTSVTSQSFQHDWQRNDALMSAASAAVRAHFDTLHIEIDTETQLMESNVVTVRTKIPISEYNTLRSNQGLSPYIRPRRTAASEGILR